MSNTIIRFRNTFVGFIHCQIIDLFFQGLKDALNVIKSQYYDIEYRTQKEQKNVLDVIVELLENYLKKKYLKCTIDYRKK